MQNQLISVIVPIYNVEAYLNRCIESIVNQTYNNIEIILVNDGSTDGSLDICKKWEKEDSRIIVIDKQNGGLASSRNVGLEIATGELIGFVDHDDYIETNMYEIMEKDMVENDAVMCSSFGVYDNSTLIKSYEGYKNLLVSGQEATKRFLNYEKLFCSSVWSKLYKRSVIGDTRFVDDIVLGEDYYFNGRLYPQINRFYYESTPLYNYRIREGTMSRNVVNEHFFDKYKVAEKIEYEYCQYNFISKKDLAHFRFSMSYEILYRLHEYKGEKIKKKKWKKIFTNDSKKYKGDSAKEIIKIFLMKYFTVIYVKFTKS